jgi:DNA ligase (NAD+)
MNELEQMKEWVATLNSAADAYYNGKAELMTDFEWDALFDKVKALEEKLGIVLPESPTNRVSADSVVGQKEEHEFLALSLAKTKQITDIVKWSENRPIWISWKLDGLTLIATYDDGNLTKVVTRGNGTVGTNITHLVSGIKGFPRKISEKGHLVIRGEAVISYDDFESYIASSQEDYANPRNLASGSLSLKDPEEIKPRNVQWLPFTLVYSEKEITSWGEQLSWLKELGFNPVECEKVESPTYDDIKSVIDKWTSKVTSGKNRFPVDGLVICYDDTNYAKTGSVTGHHATRGGLAFKWQDEEAETTLEKIEWSCAVASISPVAIFKPVQLEGTTVKRASLCNISECERLGIGSKGTKIKIIKANKIIPKVVSVTDKVGELEIPSICPVCSSPTQIKETESGTKTLRCTNASCAARELRKFMRFVSKDGMDIDGISGQTLARFVNMGWIKTAADIYKLGNHRDKISAMEGFGEKSADNLVAAIEKARKREASKFLVALSIPLCGVDVAKRLVGEYQDIEKLFATAIEAGKDDLFAAGDDVFSSIDGIGPIKSKAIVDWCRNVENQKLVKDLIAEVSFEYAQPRQTSGTCAGLTFVVTGNVYTFKNRNELKAYIESQGGKTVDAVSKSTNYLINNDLESTSSKNKKAKALNIPIISEDEFIAKFKNNQEG